MVSNNCKKLVFFDVIKQVKKTLLGLIESEDEYFVHFRTNRRVYTIAKKDIHFICDTEEPFREVLEEKQ